MAGVILKVTVDVATAQAWFEYAGFHIRDARSPMRHVMHDVVWPAIREQLDTQGARGGEPWQELSDKYREWKDLRYPGRPILMLTGKMEEALFSLFSYRTTRNSLTYRPDSNYLHWHQEGGYEPGRPPQRVVLDLTPVDYEEIQVIFDLWLHELATANIRRSPSDSFSAPLPHFNILGL